MSIKEFRLDAKSAGAQALEGLWGPGPPGDLLYDMSAKGRGRGNHGTRIGTGNVWTPSTRGIVSQFNGTDDAWNTERALATGLQNFTMMAWVYVDTSGGAALESAAPFGSGDAAAGEIMLRGLGMNGANKRFRIYGDLGTILADAAANSFNAFIDTWTHLAISRKVRSTTIDYYQNGIALATDATAGANLNTAKVFQIGCADTAVGRWWQGMLDDVRYYTRGLSIGEISHIYNATRYTPYADILLRPTRRYLQRHRAEVL